MVVIVSLIIGSILTPLVIIGFLKTVIWADAIENKQLDARVLARIESRKS